METYVDLYINSDGEKASVINKKLFEIGLKSSMGGHDFMYDWKGIVDKSEVVALADKIQLKLKGTGVFMKFITVR